ncbi:MAG TPA: hypothetical protein VGI64_18590 [Streptosporangiaceae bacterium]|jgi:hypothetical protein
MELARRALSFHILHRRGSVLWALFALATLLEVAAGTGLAYLAGFGVVRNVLSHFDWVWLLVLAGALPISFAGYYVAYRGIFRADGGPVLDRRRLVAVAAAGFGGFLAHGGGKLDQYAIRAAGADQRESQVRASALAGMEQGVLAIAATATAIVVLASPLRQPSLGVTLPWAIIPVPGLIVAFWLAERYRARFGDLDRWRGLLGRFLDSIHIIREIFLQPRRYGSAVAGMALFWVADAFATWAGLAAFGFDMNFAALFVGFATGMIFPRRTGPLAGAGVLALVLPLTIWASGAPFAAAIAGVFAYRVLALWLPMPASLAVLPELREMSRRLREPAATARQQAAPPLRAQRRVPRVWLPARPAARPGGPAAKPGEPAAQPGEPGEPAAQPAESALQPAVPGSCSAGAAAVAEPSTATLAGQ